MNTAGGCINGQDDPHKSTAASMTSIYLLVCVAQCVTHIRIQMLFISHPEDIFS